MWSGPGCSTPRLCQRATRRGPSRRSRPPSRSRSRPAWMNRRRSAPAIWAGCWTAPTTAKQPWSTTRKQRDSPRLPEPSPRRISGAAISLPPRLLPVTSPPLTITHGERWRRPGGFAAAGRSRLLPQCWPWWHYVAETWTRRKAGPCRQPNTPGRRDWCSGRPMPGCSSVVLPQSGDGWRPRPTTSATRSGWPVKYTAWISSSRPTWPGRRRSPGTDRPTPCPAWPKQVQSRSGRWSALLWRPCRRRPTQWSSCWPNAPPDCLEAAPSRCGHHGSLHHAACKRHESRRSQGGAMTDTTTRDRVGAPGHGTSLAKDRLGVSAVMCFIATAATPMTVVAGVVTTGFATTGLIGIPVAFLAIGALLVLFSVGYVAMARQVRNAGAFYAYIAHLGRPLGV